VTFLFDDIVLKGLGLEMPGVSLLWAFEQLRDYAFKELYDPDKIRDQIKENRMLFEFGERTTEEYAAMNAELHRKLKLAHRGEEMDLQVRSDIFGAR
jgi:hypothetical protein